MEKTEKLSFIKDNIGEIILSIPKTIYFNFKILPFEKAVKLPVFISHNVRLRGVNRNTFFIKGEDLATASIRIGFGGSRFSAGNGKKGLICISNGSITIGVRTGLSQGIVLDAKNANITVGEHFRCNYCTTISCEDDDIVIGDEVVFGWNIIIRNNDGHYMIADDETKSNHATINIGSHVWICAESTVLKRVKLGDNCVVGYGSIVSKANGEPNCLYAGTPAQIIRRGINWKE